MSVSNDLLSKGLYTPTDFDHEAVFQRFIELSPEKAIFVAARAALRSLAGVIAVGRFEDLAHEDQQFALRSFQAALSTVVHCNANDANVANRGQEIAARHWDTEQGVGKLGRRVDDAWSATDASERAGESASIAVSFIGNKAARIENLWTSCKRSSRVFKHLLRLENPAVKENGNIAWEGAVAGLSAVQSDIEWVSNKSLEDCDQIFREEFWRHDLCADILLPRWEFFKTSSVGSNGAWNFWIDWLESYFNSKPMDWELQRRVALGIKDETWDAGAEAVAARIEEIRAELYSKPLDLEQVSGQALRLIALPKTTKLVTHSVAEQIENAANEFMAANKVNCLPLELQPLHNLPAVLRDIGVSSQSSDRIEELEKQIVSLISKVNELTSSLEAQKSGWKRKLVAETAIKTTTQLATVTFWGTVAAGLSHVTGIVDVGGLFERLSDLGAEVAPNPEQQPDQLIDV